MLSYHHSTLLLQHGPAGILPKQSLQPGPMYFLTPESVPSSGYAVKPSHTKLIDDMGKGANAVVTVTTLKYMGSARRKNKNIIVGYLLWRVLARLHENITLSFLIAGHTKFSSDWCFGLLRKR